MDPSLQRIRELARQDSQQRKRSGDAQNCYDMLFQLEGMEPLPLERLEAPYDTAASEPVGLLPGEWLIMPELDVPQFVREHQGLKDLVQQIAQKNSFGICPIIKFAEVCSSPQINPPLASTQNRRRSLAVYPSVPKRENRRRSTSDFTPMTSVPPPSEAVATPTSTAAPSRPRVPSLKLSKLASSSSTTASGGGSGGNNSRRNSLSSTPPDSGRSRRGSSSPAAPATLAKQLSSSSARSFSSDKAESEPRRPLSDRIGSSSSSSSRRYSMPAAPASTSVTSSPSLSRSKKPTEMPSLKEAARRRTMQILADVGDSHSQHHQQNHHHYRSASKSADLL